jgi:hypothetical protein
LDIFILLKVVWESLPHGGIDLLIVLVGVGLYALFPDERLMYSIGQSGHGTVPIGTEPWVALGPLYGLAARLRRLVSLLLNGLLNRLLCLLGATVLKDALMLLCLADFRLRVKKFLLSVDDSLGITGFVGFLVQGLGLIKSQRCTGLDL